MNDFMPTRPYWILDSAELGALRAQVTEAEAAAATETDPVRRMNAEQHAKSLRRQLEDAERQALAATRPAPVPSPRPSVMPQRPTVNTAQQEFAEPVPYFAVQAQPAAPKASAPAQRPQVTHSIVCAPGYKAITEHPDGGGAILIIPVSPPSR